MKTRTLHGLVPIAVAALLAGVPALTAQQTPAQVGGISGTVLDSENTRPLQGAVVALEPEAVAALPGTGGAPFLSGGRSAVSDAEGRYRFDRLPPGRYRLRISRPGYRAATVGVELRGAADSRVSVGLTMEPVSLEPLEVRAATGEPFGRDDGMEDEIGAARVRAARQRQEAHLSSDVRELTHADVLEAVTLGETDLFRALQRVPGVGARDDYGADFWVRGASWDQTRIYFDELPLFNPVHGFGLLSAVNTDAVGGALLHPGVRSAALGDAAAGVVDVTSRAGGGDGSIRGLADLSLTSARLALDQRVLDGRGAWMLAGRRSWVDLAAAAAARLNDDPQLRLPYSFGDLTGRLDLQLEGDRALEISALAERDAITGTIPDILHRTDARWGNAAARVSYLSPLGGMRARHTAGVSRYGARVRAVLHDTLAEEGFDAPEEPPSDNALTHLSLAGELAPDLPGGRVLPWRMGYGVVHQSARYDGPEGHALGRFRIPDPDTLHRRDSSGYLYLWGERRWTPLREVSVEAGLRLEGGPPVENGGAVRAAPRLTARWSPGSNLSVSAGLGRSYQYTQALTATGPIIGSGNAASHLWLVADRRTPAIRADIATLGAELWLGESWLLSANAYARRSTGVTLPDPSPGTLVDRPLFVTGENAARGVELAGRRLAGRWTASASYTLARSEMEAAGLRYPASEDRLHAVDLTAMLRVGAGLRLGGAFTYASGAPYTRAYVPYWECTSADCDPQLRVEAPNAQRVPDYSSLDLLLDWTLRLRGWELGTYLQLRNALAHENAVTVDETMAFCPGLGYPANCPTEYQFSDTFQMGLPTVPVLGFRARF